jgi:hypothetical protein
MKEKGQGILEFGIVIVVVAVAVLAILSILRMLPMPDFEAAAAVMPEINLPNVAAAVMPEVKLPNVGDHDLDRHADVISATVSCFSGNGTIYPTSMHNPNTNRDAWMCMMDFKMYIWIVDELKNTVTQFQNKSKTFEAAMEYLTKVGYK